MSVCAYCERPLECDTCRSTYWPEGPDAYWLLFQADEPVACPTCGQTLVCHWCKTPYDGQGKTQRPDDAG